MNKIFVGIAKYIMKNPECRKKTAYEIYNSYFALNPQFPKTLKDVKLVVDYIDRLKKAPVNLLTDALKEV